MTRLPAHVAENRRYWDEMAASWVAPGERNWQMSEPVWGIWDLPETELRMLPEDMGGMRAIELGCGTGYVSSWMIRRGATVLGIDNSARQLETARRLAAKHALPLELRHGNAEQVDAPDGSFDFAISEYGAAIWCDPDVWIPEAHRLLRSGGRLVFLGNHPLAMICSGAEGEPVGRRLEHPYFGMRRFDWTHASLDPGGIEFNLPIGGWLALFARTGFEVEEYLELGAPEHASGRNFQIDAEWARRWPSEQVWKLRKR